MKKKLIAVICILTSLGFLVSCVEVPKPDTPPTLITKYEIVISAAEDIAAVEGGKIVDYTIELSSKPNEDVRVTATADAQTKVSINNSDYKNEVELTFTPDNWNKPRPVSIQAIDDGKPEGQHKGIITNKTDGSNPKTVEITITDNNQQQAIPQSGNGDTPQQLPALSNEEIEVEIYSLYFDEKGSANFFSENSQLKSNGRNSYRIQFTPSQDCYVYAYEVFNGTDNTQPMFDLIENAGNEEYKNHFFKKDKTYFLPAKRNASFKTGTVMGETKIYFLAISRELLKEPTIGELRKKEEVIADPNDRVKLSENQVHVISFKVVPK